MGTCTWGGLIGIGGYPSPSSFPTRGEGRDRQLEKGVDVAPNLLKRHPAPEPKRPPYPVYDWKKVRETVALKATEAPSATSPIASTQSDR